MPPRDRATLRRPGPAAPLKRASAPAAAAHPPTSAGPGARIAAIAEIDESVRGDLEVLGIIPEHVGADLAARAECARVIADDAAQGE